ncbi:hypothetical protein DFJ58DRAFT_730932 [Suillus subalutaceus]|uniref:uncharacterized protein n=1 Tax=Suillus subalutaceus TaxID=48586 RepID=UPI001B86FFAA|nr:uncharacterized protein DFJ58DRAFT_730932 [Suillus subalutaceus]KAG1845082.1 hypothetical protein DFJ58DRAFT_730932 [Suillus subalutaceus]
MADHDTIKLELPAQLKTFKFTFECRRPGPLTIEISMQRSLKQSKSQPSTSESPDTSETQTERLEILTHWLQAQETGLTQMLDLFHKALQFHYTNLYLLYLTAFMIIWRMPSSITGYLQKQDLGIATPSSPLPNLGPNMRSPEALIAAIDHFDVYDNATATGPRPLTPHDAHQLPVDPEQHAFERQLARTFKEMRDEDVEHVDQVDKGLDDDVDIDVDANFDDQDQDSFESLNTGPNEDDPDPFLSEEVLDPPNNMEFADVPLHLLTIYALVLWLHLQFHLPRVACNALLAVFACLYSFVVFGCWLFKSFIVVGIRIPIILTLDFLSANQPTKATNCLINKFTPSTIQAPFPASASFRLLMVSAETSPDLQSPSGISGLEFGSSCNRCRVSAINDLLDESGVDSIIYLILPHWVPNIFPLDYFARLTIF